MKMKSYSLPQLQRLYQKQGMLDLGNLGVRRVTFQIFSRPLFNLFTATH